MREYIRKNSIFLPAAVAFFMPFGIRPLVWLIVLWTFVVILRGDWRSCWKENMNSRGKRVFLLLLLFFFFLHVIRIRYPDGLKEGMGELEIKLSFLLLPFLFTVTVRWTHEKQVKILRFFVAGVLFAALLCYGNALTNSLHFADGRIRFLPHPENRPWDNYFLYYDFSFRLHPSYFAMYVSFAVLLILESFPSEGKRIVSFPRFIMFLLIMFFFITIVLLSSRAGFFTFAFVVISYFLKRIREHSTPKEKALVLIGMLLGVAIFIYSFLHGERTKLMFRQIGSIEKWDHDPHYPGSIALRFILWEDAWAIIRDHPWWGTGTGSARTVLYRGKTEGRYLWPSKEKLNVHNQFLETWLEQGITALWILLAIVFFPFYRNDFSPKRVFYVLVWVVVINFLFESMLARVNGVVFLVFFYCLLVCGSTAERKITHKSGRQEIPDLFPAFQDE